MINLNESMAEIKLMTNRSAVGLTIICKTNIWQSVTLPYPIGEIRGKDLGKNGKVYFLKKKKKSTDLKKHEKIPSML